MIALIKETGLHLSISLAFLGFYSTQLTNGCKLFSLLIKCKIRGIPFTKAIIYILPQRLLSLHCKEYVVSFKNQLNELIIASEGMLFPNVNIILLLSKRDQKII